MFADTDTIRKGQFYTSAEVMEFIGIGRTHFYDLVRRRKISYNQVSDKPGCPLRFLGKDIQQFLDDHRIERRLSE
jgi:Helix-turn-helix domain